MALIQTWVNCSLGELVKMQYLDGNLFSTDNQGNLIGVNVYDRNGDPAELQGSVSANVLRPNGDMVTVSGSRDRNRCSVILPQACYSYPGSLIVIIKLTDGNTITTLAAVVANIYQSTYDPVVDPGTILPSIQTLIDRINTIRETIPLEYDELCATIATPFSSSTFYGPGQYVTYDNALYVCTTAHSGSWDASHFQRTSVGSEITKFANELHILQPVATSADVGKIPKVKSVANGKVTEYEFVTIEGSGGTSDYEDLENKPQINSVTLVGNTSLDTLGIASKASVTSINTDLNILKPTATSSDIGKTLIVKTVSNGKVTAYEFGESRPGTLDYTELTNKPSINNVLLTGNRSLNDLGIASKSSVTTIENNITNINADLNILKPAATSSDIGKVPVVKSVANGHVTEYEFGEGGGGTTDYSDLDNKPSINNVMLTGNRSLNDLGIASSIDLNALDERVAELEYNPLTLNSLTVSPSLAEIGSTVTSATLSYSMSKAATLMQLDGTDISNTASSGTIPVTGLSLTSSKTWTVRAQDARMASRSEWVSRTATLTFTNKVKYTATGIPSEVNDAFLNGFATKTLSTGKIRSFSVNAGSGQYIWYALPSGYGACAFTVNGFTGGFSLIRTFNHTNESGYTTEYRVYRSDNANLGSTSVTVT